MWIFMLVFCAGWGVLHIFNRIGQRTAVRIREDAIAQERKNFDERVAEEVRRRLQSRPSMPYVVEAEPPPQEDFRN